jgi:outer membrane murein-binding lipoprotein Lpp
MFGFPKRLYEETRRNFRVKEVLPINWTIAGMESGSGRVCDISSTGALIEAHATRPIGDGTVIALAQEAGPLGAFLPPEGRIVWSKPRGLFKKSTLCGVEFTNASSEVNDRLKKRIQERIGEMELTDKVISAITIVLVLVMLGLGGVVMAQRSSIYQTVERSNVLALNTIGQQAKIYEELLTQHKILETFYAELQSEYAATRILLAQTEGLLAEAKRQYAEAQTEISTLRSALAQAKMETLGENVKVLVAQRDSLREDLKALENEINALALENPEGWQAQSGQYANRMDELDLRMKNLKYETLLARIGDHQKQVQAMKNKVHQLKQQAAAAKRETQRKKDELALSQGNRGFIVLDGKFLDSKDFLSADSEPKSSTSPAKKVNINVSVF